MFALQPPFYLVISPVHTTGVNAQSLLANVVAILVIVGFFTGVIVRQVKRSIADEVDKAMVPIVARLDEHETKIARLEGVEEGKRYAVDAAGVSANPRRPLATDSESTTTTTSRTKRRKR